MLSERDDMEVAQYEDLRSCANRAVWTIKLQVRRLRDFPAELQAGSQFVLQQVSDAEFLILSLDRLLAVSCRIDAMTRGALRRAITEFERALPNLRTARNVISHVDEYLLGDGRDTSVGVGSISTSVLDPDHLVFAGFDFNVREGLRVAEELFFAIQENPPESYRRAVAAAR